MRKEKKNPVILNGVNIAELMNGKTCVRNTQHMLKYLILIRVLRKRYNYVILCLKKTECGRPSS